MFQRRHYKMPIIFGTIKVLSIYLLSREVQKKLFGKFELSIFPSHALAEDPVDEPFLFQSSNRVVPRQH